MPDPSARPSRAPLIIIATLVAGGIGVGIVGPNWEEWAERRDVWRGHALLRSGMHDGARIGALRALQRDRKNVEALRILIDSLPRGNANAEVLLRSRLADLATDDSINFGRLALAAMQTGQFQIAAKALRDLARVEGESVAVLELRARLGAATGDFTSANRAARQLLAERPRNPVGRLIAALWQIFGTDATARAQGETELRELIEQPELRVEALRGLREATARRGASAEALAFAATVIAEPSATFTDQLAWADLLAQTHAERLEEALSTLTKQAGNDPSRLGVIGTWLRKRGRADRIEAWVRDTPALQRDAVTTQMILAETFAASAAWQPLDALLTEARWGEFESLKAAFQAKAKRGLGDESAASRAWREAIEAALGGAPAGGRALYAAVKDWPDWHEEVDGLLWRIQRQGASEASWSLRELFARYRTRRETIGLRRVSEAMLELDPASATVKNNLAYYSLLLRNSETRAHKWAEELATSHFDNPVIAATYAFSLWRRERATEALARLEKLAPADLAQPEIALCHALVLSATGQQSRAQEVAQRINAGGLLAEESALLKSAGLSATVAP